jgi:hypothetical protein
MIPRPNSTRRLAGAAVGAATLAMTLVACGDDDASEASAEACDAYATVSGRLLIGMVDPAEAPVVLETFTTTAPDAIAADATVVADGIRAMFAEEGDPFADTDFTSALSEVGEHYFDACEVGTKVDAEGVDYAFEGVPAEVDAGRVAIRFTNETEQGEPHEIVLLRRPDGDTTPVAEIAAMPMEELMGSYQMAGVAFADSAGSSFVTFLDLEEGSYVAICNLPTAGDESDPHAAHGMVQDVEVVA